MSTGDFFLWENRECVFPPFFSPRAVVAPEQPREAYAVVAPEQPREAYAVVAPEQPREA